MADTKEPVVVELDSRDADNAPETEDIADGGDNVPTAEEDYSKAFDPLVVLTEVETKTGEEDEDVIFKIRAKLFRFDKSLSEWKERGTGDARLLRHKETKKIRLLMRREKTLKICMNHYVNPTIALSENVGSDRSWVFQAIDYADGEADESLLAIRFANSENANLFRTHYNDARDHMRKLLAGAALPSDKDASPPEPKSTTEKDAENANVTAPEKTSVTHAAAAPEKPL